MPGKAGQVLSQTAADSPYRWRWLALVALLVAEGMNLLDSTIVQVAAPVIHADLGGSVSDIQWFSSAYTLPFALLLISGGRLGDMFGRRRVFRVGVTGFMLASLACALAFNPTELIVCRIVQGAAAAVIIPQTIGLIKSMFDGPELSKALGSIGPVMGLASVCGPVLGGVLTQADLFGSSWRSVFLVNIPLSAIVLAMAPTVLENRAPHRPRLDLVGTLLAVAGTAGIVYPLIGADLVHMGAPRWLSIGFGVLVLIGFGVHQGRSARAGRSPLVEASLFSHREFPAALATSTLFFAVTTGLMMVVVLHLELGTGTDVLPAGLSLSPWSVGLAIASWVAGASLVPRFGNRVMTVGLTILIAGVLLAITVYFTATPGVYPTWLLGALGVIGVGIGLFSPSFFTQALHQVAPQEIGSAAGLLNAVQQLGATFGIAVLGSVYFNSSANGSPPAALHAVELAFWTAAGLLAACAVSTGLMVGRKTREPVAES